VSAYAQTAGLPEIRLRSRPCNRPCISSPPGSGSVWLRRT